MHVITNPSVELLKYVPIRPGWLPTFSEFAADAAVGTLVDRVATAMGAVNVPFSPMDVSSLVVHLYVVYLFRAAGSPVFHVRPNLARLLCATDPPLDFPVAEIHLPFEGIRLQFPKGILEDHPDIDSLYISALSGDRFRVVATFTEKTESSVGKLAAGPVLRVDFAGFPLSTDPKCTIRAAMEEAKMFDAVTPGWDDMAQALQVEDFYAGKFFMFALNAVLYISSEHADVAKDDVRWRAIHTQLQGLKKGRKRTELEEKFQKVRNIYICGASVPMPRELSARLTTEGRELTRRFRVRGHFRNQVHGVGRQERKIIWVAPFWKGPTYAELLERNYILREVEV